ncbi:hypothetical protein ILYODFUR_020847, partial [Ilyodon furcidens]
EAENIRMRCVCCCSAASSKAKTQQVKVQDSSAQATSYLIGPLDSGSWTGTGLTFINSVSPRYSADPSALR